MKRALRFRRRARLDVLAARDYFDDQMQGLGERFSLEVSTAMKRAQELPDAWPEYERGVRRIQVGAFKYHVYYRAERRSLTVLRVLHAQSDPDMLSALVGYEDE